jgi:biopolymer transport protein ExbB/TolQ
MNNTIVDAMRRALARSAAVVHAEMKRGLNGLASIAATATFLGFFGTVMGINNSFRGFSGEYSRFRPFVIQNLAEALVPTGLDS